MSSWSDLSFDILRSIAECLPYTDLFRFGAVCKSWRDCVVRGIHYAPIIIRYCSYEQEYALELVDLLRMQYHHIGNMDIRQGHQLFGCRLHASKHGWLLLSKPQEGKCYSFFFFDPLAGKTIELPSLNMDGKFDNEEDVKVAATFSTSPTHHDDCVIFMVLHRSTDGQRSKSKHCFISTCNLNDKRWITRNYSRPPQDHEVEALAYVDGVFHCVFSARDFSLIFATFHVASEDWVMTDYSAFSKIQRFKFPGKYYLVEAGGELLFAFYGLDHSFDGHGEIPYWHIYQFDRSQKNWTRVLRLGNRALLLYGTSSSIMMSLAEGEAMEIADKVFRFDYEWRHCSTGIDNNKGELLRPSDELSLDQLSLSREQQPTKITFTFIFRHFGFR